MEHEKIKGRLFIGRKQHGGRGGGGGGASTSSSSLSSVDKSSIIEGLEGLVYSTPFVDSHVHLDFVLERKSTSFQELRKAEFGDKYAGAINVCCFKSTFSTQEKLIGEDSVFSTFGVHPHDAMQYDDVLEERVLQNMKSPTVVAWGECGLDYFKSQSTKEQQHTAFLRQMKRAVEVNKPLVVHSRDAGEDTVRLMSESLPLDWKIHLHCFTGEDFNFANEMMKRFPNLCIGFTGAITFSSAKNTREKVVKNVPIERILLETDGPFIAPQPNRGKVAHCGMIPLVANEISKVKGMTLDEVLRHAYQNTNKIYGCFAPLS